ncbi:DUF1097 domain-containing protein [Clostridium ljungdahlii]|uniref:Inner membrane protein YcdZ n=1 Tax=Clostridium ljungdahlii TaxID=1538 RepID=A0A162LAF8_9CLOT|nr:DUF1097 domain-containing protein [Clostridium ljungdahlii]OAA86798.1 Inner membrane protein YcdZ [Clostridium ljungdahlii]
MDYLTSVAITIAILAGLWAGIGLNFGLIIWIGFISWACYFASGAKVEGLTKTLVANLVGALWAFIAIQGFTLLNKQGLSLPVAVGIAVGIVCFIMVLEARIDILSFIPGAFAGAGSQLFIVRIQIHGTKAPWNKSVGILGRW